MTYKPIPTRTEGGQKKAVVSDDSGRQLLAQILIELQKINTQLALMNENIVAESDILEG